MKERKEKKRFGLIIFMVIIMIGTSFSFIFYGFNTASQKGRYKDFVFSSNGNMWLANIDGKTAAFTFLPQETEEIEITSLPQLQGKLEIDATSDINSTFNQSIALSEHQMSLTLANYNIFLRQGFTKKNQYNMAVITCKDATANVPVIYFMQSNRTAITGEGNCVIAEASSDSEFIKLKDRLLYSILGVIDG